MTGRDTYGGTILDVTRGDMMRRIALPCRSCPACLRTCSDASGRGIAADGGFIAFGRCDSPERGRRIPGGGGGNHQARGRASGAVPEGKARDRGTAE